MKKIEAKAKIKEMATEKGAKVSIKELGAEFVTDGQNVICSDGVLRSDNSAFYPDGKKGTARGCISVAKVNFADAVLNVFESKYKKFENDFTEVEKNGLQALKYDFADVLAKIQCVFETCNNRIAEQAKEAAKAKRAEAAKERAQKKVGEKIAAGSDSEKIAAIAAALGVSYEVAATIYKEQKQTA